MASSRPKRPRDPISLAVMVGRIATGVFYFVRIHQTLRVTPAMEAGVTHRLMTLEDMVGIVDEWETRN